MSFASVLFTGGNDQSAADERPQPDYFTDLNLDQVVASLTAGREEYDLAPFFHARLTSVEAVAYRQAVFGDLEDDALTAGIGEFAGRMRDMRRRLSQADRLRHRYQRQRWFVDAIEVYCEAVVGLAATLEKAHLASEGLRSMRDHVRAYTGSEEFETLQAGLQGVRQALASVHCSLTITGGSVKVRRYEEEADYGAEVLAAFERFKQAEAKSHRVGFTDFVEMNHVDRLRAAGLSFCYPEVSQDSKQLLGREVFDLALAGKLVASRTPVIPNDFHLDDPERILVVSGPNQGGKTTFARTFGQLHHLAALGCPVPGRQARLFLCDQLFTHFERGENLTDLSGKLQDDLVRIHDILDQATDAGIVIMNEVFTSTTLRDAMELGTRVLEQIITLDLLCVCVTFVDELASLGPSTVSMVATVAPDDPAVRTYRVVRGPADGLSYAMAIADKYGITYDRLIERLNGHTTGRPAS